MHPGDVDSGSIKRICVQWPRLGPYHLARLQATHRFLAKRGCELIALETASADRTYAWRIEDGANDFRREQVFPGQTFDDLTPLEVHKQTLRVLDDLQPDAVAIHSYSFPDSRACLLWCRRNRKIAIVMTDSSEDDGPRVAWRESLKSILVRQYDAGLAAGTPQREYLEKLGIPRGAIFLGYDVVDNEYFARGAQDVRRDPYPWWNRLGIPQGTQFFLSVNRMLPYKNLDGLLHAYRRYREAVRNPWSLVLVGDGPDQERIRSLIKSHAIDGVIMPGFRQIEELPGYYALAGALVHPTFRDTWGLTVNEAMASSLPVVVSNRAGCAIDLVKEGDNGFRFDPNEIETLATLLERIAQDDDARRRMGTRSKEIIDEWSLELFSSSVWSAAQAGRARANRSIHPLANVLIHSLAYTARKMDSFQALPI